MRKSSHKLPAASQFETLKACNVGDGSTGTSRHLYAVEGVAGIFRRVRRTGKGLKAGDPGNVVAQFDGSAIELALDGDITRELQEAGILPCPKKPETPPDQTTSPPQDQPPTSEDASLSETPPAESSAAATPPAAETPRRKPREKT